MPKGACPNCKSPVEAGRRPHVGQRLVCETCQTPVEVVWLYPLELDFYIERDVTPREQPKVGEVKTTEEDAHDP